MDNLDSCLSSREHLCYFANILFNIILFSSDNMLGGFLAAIGGSIGKYFGGGILSTIGRYAGRYLGSHLEQKWLHNKKIAQHKVTQHFANIKDSFHLSKAEYGKPIPLVFGSVRVPGQIIWCNKITEKRSTDIQSKYFEHTNTTVEKHIITLEYYLSFAIALCEGAIHDIERVWIDGELVDLSKYKFTLYLGSEEQMPDPIITALSTEHALGYRGLAYIVFDELPLADFGNIIPQFYFEVTRRPNIKQIVAVEEMVESMVMIPGTGEYVYDTQTQMKSLVSAFGGVISQEKINSHNYRNIANSIQSLNQLQLVCPNIKWVSPVVCWFANSMSLPECNIKPAIEFSNQTIQYSAHWQVGQYDRTNAHEISKDQDNHPLYGGTVNDESIIRYLVELRNRGLKIMFYPMFFMDVAQKPWRGRLTGVSTDIAQFFQKKHGYNAFILHYANLVKNHVDAFIIGSELIGLTRVRANDHFPAVDELVKLAQQVKQILGSGVKVSYAADWSEYHHTEEGWFNLDPLWASKDIDFIGIDAYFPLSDSTSSIITAEEIRQGMTSGEGYDYYLDANKTRRPIEPAYAWKNIRYWWENRHQNPNGQYTTWIPRTKNIWFTEFGFPSIDKAPNQPNVFFDPKCIDGGIPTASNGDVDFMIQRVAIRTFIEYWKTQEYIDQMFLWTWDARPYPAWPHMPIWCDNYLWLKGHWVNNKFGVASLAAIIMEISHRCQISSDQVDIELLDQPVSGFLLSNKITGIDAINTLRSCYFFDMSTHGSEKITFVKRGYNKKHQLSTSDFLKISDNSFLCETLISSKSILGKIDLYFIDQNNEYAKAYQYINNETEPYVQRVLMMLPIVMHESEAKQIGKAILHNAAVETKLLQFRVPIMEHELRPTDFIMLRVQNVNYSLRVIDIEYKGLNCTITSIIDYRDNYHVATAMLVDPMPLLPQYEEKLRIIYVPDLMTNLGKSYCIAYLNSTRALPLYAKINNFDDEQWIKVKDITPTNSIAKVVAIQQSKHANIFHIDEESKITVSIDKLDRDDTNDWQYAFLGSELISYKYIQQVGTNLYEISHLIRGILGTDKYVSTHQPSSQGEDLIFLKDNSNYLPISNLLDGYSMGFKCGSQHENILFNDYDYKVISPYVVEQRVEGQILHLRCIMRSKNSDGWRAIDSNNKQNFMVIVSNSQEKVSVTTDQTELQMNLGTLDLSQGYCVDIMLL